VRVLWSYDGKKHSVAVPRGVKVLDVWGNTVAHSGTLQVADAPIYWLG
jgi:hypothetical protein